MAVYRIYLDGMGWASPIACGGKYVNPRDGNDAQGRLPKLYNHYGTIFDLGGGVKTSNGPTYTHDRPDYLSGDSNAQLVRVAGYFNVAYELNTPPSDLQILTNSLDDLLDRKYK